jgi:hypothetical protein
MRLFQSAESAFKLQQSYTPVLLPFCSSCRDVASLTGPSIVLANVTLIVPPPEAALLEAMAARAAVGLPSGRPTVTLSFPSREWLRVRVWEDAWQGGGGGGPHGGSGGGGRGGGGVGGVGPPGGGGGVKKEHS